MKAKTRHFSSVHVVYNLLANDGRIKIEVTENYTDEPLTTFWVPATSMVQIGKQMYVPTDIIKARCKAVGITYDCNSATYK